MKEKQLMKGAAFMLLAATAIPPETNAGVQYLLSQSKDMSQDFLDLSNTYFFADSLVSFDTSTGKGTVQWKRQQLMPRQAFNANTYLHQPLPHDAPSGKPRRRIKVPSTPPDTAACSSRITPGAWC